MVLNIYSNIVVKNNKHIFGVGYLFINSTPM